jgi:GntR family carbon starvation induced transcriptional regulator
MDLQGVSDETLARVAADRMVSDIVSGALKPGRKLRVVELKNHYGIGASPLREALLLVTSLGYATGESHRGYRVAEVSPEDLADITRAREILEEGMLGASMANSNDEWEIGVGVALERLRRAVTKAGPDGFQSSDAVAASHKLLHAALVSNCGSSRLMDTQSLLFDQARRYRDVMFGGVKSPIDFIRVHEELVEVVLGGHIDRARLALREHLNLTPRNVYPT